MALSELMVLADMTGRITKALFESCCKMLRVLIANSIGHLADRPVFIQQHLLGKVHLDRRPIVENSRSENGFKALFQAVLVSAKKLRQLRERTRFVEVPTKVVFDGVHPLDI